MTGMDTLSILAGTRTVAAPPSGFLIRRAESAADLAAYRALRHDAFVVAQHQEPVHVVQHGLEDLRSDRAEGLLPDARQHFVGRLEAGGDQAVLVLDRRRRIGGHHRAKALEVDLRVLGAARIPEIAVLVSAVTVLGQEMVVAGRELRGRGLGPDGGEEVRAGR